MARRRVAERERSWSDSSFVFVDTQQVDLFDDPPWESTRPRPSVRPSADGRPAIRRAAKRVLPFRRAKRGLHSAKHR